MQKLFKMIFQNFLLLKQNKLIIQNNKKFFNLKEKLLNIDKIILYFIINNFKLFIKLKIRNFH